eukprot:CAMPEP_0114359918 /NCGR_PEP_ID=MMETSP0101-20121206/23400_1 /TAXON_ID=38822 ORGANISM="Pteridomonas danica, Strain PT" /NCGR_SAMPLE_ID=MMETSP0101 /ASSEMBLY_ACC=CAM_ASM_000211 /LENGTH=586 /DNA_ID=CAMNT_0001503747 /DNA_START=137 /DNA_END=1897 /DNA_ORIENTATION=-
MTKNFEKDLSNGEERVEESVTVSPDIVTSQPMKESDNGSKVDQVSSLLAQSREQSALPRKSQPVTKNSEFSTGLHHAKSMTRNVISTTGDMTKNVISTTGDMTKNVISTTGDMTKNVISTTGDALNKLGEATIGKESVDNLNMKIQLAESKIGSVASGVSGVASDVVGNATGKLTNIVTTVVKNEKLRETFDSANELGRGAIARAFKQTEIDALALRLLRGHNVYSKSYKSDLWLHLKNKQIFLSLFLAHPQHPFNRAERISALVVSCLLAWGLEFWFCIYWTSCDEHPNMNFVEMFIKVLLLKIAISASLNGIYDAILEQAMTCACVQEGCPAGVKNGCEMLSLVQLIIQLGGGVLILALGALALAGDFRPYGIPGRSQGFEDVQFFNFVLITIRELFIGKCVGLFVVTVLIECLGFHFGRLGQMKPPKSDEEARLKWNDETMVGCCGVVKPPQNTLWNRFIGEDLEMEDLPDYAPTYDVDVYICGKIMYSERADNPGQIPKWFLEKDEIQRRSLLPQNPSKVAPMPNLIETSETKSDSDPEIGGWDNANKITKRRKSNEKVTIQTADDFFLSGIVIEADVENQK